MRVAAESCGAAFGVRAWEQWERRTVTLTFQHLKTVRFHRNGQRSYEYTGDKTKYWSPEGERISQEEFLEHYWGELTTETHDDQSGPPMQSFIWWWNDW